MTDDYDGPEVDPDFPDRPNHPDFWKLAAVVKQNDRTSETQGFGTAMQIDAASAGYMAGQRWLRAKTLLATAEDGSPISEHDRAVILWLDGLAAGMRFAQIEADGRPIQPDGNRRQRRTKKA